ncbi:MASE1 domain-containing protein [Streptacidiphilus jiangxiensis]|uniref:Integral membrane sensor domain MASE1 n=1 Tax=Streptacidiphilus jiangxiensis TaxID=235985 RepID=A0A1H7UVT2_STRJI|nr:MASE1 domain-containing protein [Streptacidiphilus jiangxiensis]SEM00839.1 Integral membrane sensor domain MASE1 [Streptacidiphilus jiangxiensis]
MSGEVRAGAPRAWVAALLWIVVVAGVYYGSGRLGLLAQIVVGGVRVTPLWPPTGVAVAALLLLGLRVWPGIAIGQALVVLSISHWHPSWAGLGIVVGATVAPVLAWLLLRSLRFRPQLDRLRDGVSLVFAALASMLVSASVSTLILLAEGVLPAGNYWEAWAAWWTGDAMGVLVITPLVLAGRYVRLPADAPVLRWAELMALLGATLGVMVLATHSSLSVLFLVFPLVIWAAIRFQVPGAAPIVLMISVLAVVAAIRHEGPFAHHGVAATMFVLQALNGSAALTALLLAAVITERDNTHRMIAEACAGLAEVVARLAPDEVADRWPGAKDD